MKFPRPGRRWLAGWLVTALLFAQLAAAAHACPHARSGAAAMPACHAAQPAPELDQPQLCKAHCEQGSQSFNTGSAPDLPPPMPVLLAVLDWASAAPMPLPARPTALRSGASPPGAPPLYIALQVLRN